MNVSVESINTLYELISECFSLNRKLDRQVSVLGTKFAMNNTAQLCHQGFAHLFPKLADEIGEKCLERYNISVEYGFTQEAKEDYSTAQDIINLINEEVIEFQNMLMGAVKFTYDNGDIQIYSDLLEILKDYNKIVEQSILLVDKAELYKDNMANYDAHIKDYFWVL